MDQSNATVGQDCSPKSEGGPVQLNVGAASIEALEENTAENKTKKEESQKVKDACSSSRQGI